MVPQLTVPRSLTLKLETESFPVPYRLHASVPLPLRHTTLLFLLRRVLSSKTLSAVDEAAAHVTNAFGDIIDDLGDFVVQRVKDLPDTIKQVSDTVNKAVNDGREQVRDGNQDSLDTEAYWLLR